MKPLIVLLSVFFSSLLVTRYLRGSTDLALSGRIAMSVMLLFTAVGHFTFAKGMAMMLPDLIPYKPEIVHGTGIIEVAAAVGILIPGLRVITAWSLIIFFILILPANIYAAVKHIDYQNGTFDGSGPAYLWFRVPLQVFFIIWTYLSSVKR